MGINRQQIDVHRKGEVIGHNKLVVAGRDVELRVTLQLQQHGKLRGRLVGEIDPHAGLQQLRLAGGLHVCVQDKVGSLVEAQRHSIGLDVRHGAGLPEEEMAVGIEDLRLDHDVHAAETCAGLFFLLARNFLAVDQDIGVMHQALVAGSYLYRFDPARVIDGNRQNEIPVRVEAGGCQSIRLRGLNDEIGLSELPSLGELWLRRQVGRIALVIPCSTHFANERQSGHR